ncbi:hypothetical protein HMPREF1210_00659 [Paenisporosarcina sp. HGH0030]|uniref:hypothetical protein n=1 Tax=Paenisporosarcina sp. HGH0030 TaxID=1078085 RepID=UPI00034E0F70|nr:hypothetical protein [Paenisporosarcina sp. HGH0030]EPD53836.1 hypothetical protein HMPREF1210_00659 [Paenisporosarcina sp. HGH0030]
MNYKDLMKSKGYIYLNNLSEPEENALCILIDRCKISNKSEDIDLGERLTEAYYPFEVDDGLPAIQLEFKSYVSYSVIDESFTVVDEYEVFQGEIFKVYTKSRYLDFIKAGTIAEDIFPEDNFVHYQVPCLNHIIDIISYEEPKITEKKRG